MLSYIHGFNSSALSSSGERINQTLCKEFGTGLLRLEYDSAACYSQNFAKLKKDFEAGREEQMLIIGTSLGAYYAYRLGEACNCPVAMFNPCMRPKTLLRKFLGWNTNFSTGEKYQLFESALEDYEDISKALKDTLVFVSDQDELITGNLSMVQAAFPVDQIRIIHTPHRIPDFMPYFADLQNLYIDASKEMLQKKEAK